MYASKVIAYYGLTNTEDDMNADTTKTLNDIIADSLESTPVTVADDFYPDIIETFDATATIAQLRKPSVKVLNCVDGEVDFAAVERELNRVAEGESVRVKVALIEAVIERVRDTDDRLEGAHDLDVGNTYAWGAWASVLTGSALAWSPDSEGEVVTATLDHVVEAIYGDTNIYYLDESGVVIF